MKTQAEQSGVHHSNRAVAHRDVQMTGHKKQGLSFVDKRPECVTQATMQSLMNNAPVLQRQADLIQMVGIKSADLQLALTGQVVAKAPNGFSAARFQDAGNSIHQVSLDDLPGNAGTFVDGNDRGARVDKQGNINSGGKTWSNIQVQANRTAGGADYTDLTYPGGTSAAQKGTSIAGSSLGQ